MNKSIGCNYRAVVEAQTKPRACKEEEQIKHPKTENSHLSAKMSLRTRSGSSKQDEQDAQQSHSSLLPQPLPATPPAPPAATLPRQALSQALTTTANLANLLPTGTLLAFQLLTPVFTRNGACDAVTRLMTQALLLALAASCFLASFTDSFRLSDGGRVYYGFATPRGMWLFDYDEVPVPDLSKYRLRLIDLVHAALSVLVFGSVALRDRYVLSCLYPQPKQETQEVLDILPLGVGVVCGLLFVVFPTRRHGIGYPVTNGRKEAD